MHPALKHNVFLVKEHVGLFRASSNYDIYDPDTRQKILECREPHLGLFTRIFRFTDYKSKTPFHIEVRDLDGKKVLSVKRGVTLLTSRVKVFDGEDRLVGQFQQKLFSIGGKFNILDAMGNPVCTLQGKWTSWDFRFLRGNEELARVAKKWAGIGKELFTSADNYVIAIDESVGKTDAVRISILAAVLCIDMVLKE